MAANIAKGTIYRIGQTIYNPAGGHTFKNWVLGYTDEQKAEAERLGQQMIGTYYDAETGLELYCGYSPEDLLDYAEAHGLEETLG